MVHRSQHDPLAADSDASRYVLQDVSLAPQAHPPEPGREPPARVSAARQAELAELGIFYDDGYDYMQHLRERGGMAGSELVAADPQVMAKLNPDTVKYGLDLPLEVLPSQAEEPVGLLNLAAPHRCRFLF